MRAQFEDAFCKGKPLGYSSHDRGRLTPSLLSPSCLAVSGQTFSCRPKTVSLVAVAFSALVLLSTPSLQADWLHYRGPAQNGVSPEKGWNAQFPSAGPSVLWKKKLGKGTSAVTVKGDRAYTMGNAGGKDSVYCFNTKTGAELWRHDFPLELDPNMFEGGPRATPTIDGDLVYTVSHQGDLWCLNATTGAKVWYKHYQRELSGKRPTWGYAGSPTIVGNMVICDVGAPGASTIAFDKATGAIIWKSGSDGAGYSTPVAATLDGRPTIVIFKADALVGLDQKTGAELWRTPWKTDYDVNAASPLIFGSDRVFITSGYNTGCAMFQVSGGQLRQLWKNKNLRAQINSPAPWEGRIYGTDNNASGNLVCLDASTGEEIFEERTVKGATLIATDAKLIVLTEKGELVTVDASKPAFRQIARAKVLENRCWVQPTLDAGQLYLRNNEGDLVCLQLK